MKPQDCPNYEQHLANCKAVSRAVFRMLADMPTAALKLEAAFDYLGPLVQEVLTAQIYGQTEEQFMAEEEDAANAAVREEMGS